MEVGGRHRRLGGWGVNVGLRALIVAFAVEATLAGADPRFAGKGIAVRNMIFAGTALTLTFPLLHTIRRERGSRYPLLADSLFLSILAVDMAANSLNLYEQAWRLDLLPHTYGPMAGYLALRTLGVATGPGMVLVNVAHLLHEIQEALGDIVFGTHNVRGWADTMGDLAAGLVGSVAIPWLWARRHSEPSPKMRRGSVPARP